MITRALGTDPDVDVDTFVVEAQDGDVFLICSDGLTDMVGDEEILDAARAVTTTSTARRSTGRRREPRRRRGQHHRRRVHDQRGRRDTVQLPAQGQTTTRFTACLRRGRHDGRPPEQIEHVLLVPGSEEARGGAPGADRRCGPVRLVLAMLALLGIAAALLVWGLLR